MALFKIQKGLAANLATNRPNANEGFCYFTTDDGKFYIDIAGDGTNASLAVLGTNRICLNAAHADSASRLTVSAGGPTQPVYIDSVLGIPKSISYYINADVDSGMTGKLAYYSSNEAISPYLSTVGSATNPVYIANGVPTVITAYGGNAATATAFASPYTIQLTGDVVGTASSTGGWTINTTIDYQKVTNDMLAGSIANSKLINSAIIIAGTSVELGGVLSADTLRTSLGLSNAMHFIGKATADITDGGTEDPVISGYSFTTARKPGDVIINKDNNYEYVWSSEGKWESLGPDYSFKLTQTPVDTGTVTTNTWIARITQNANGEITVTKDTLDTSGTWTGNAATATELASQGTTGQFWRGDNTWSNVLAGGLTVDDLTDTALFGNQAVSTDNNGTLVSSNLTTTDPVASGNTIEFISSISQSSIGKITVTKSEVRQGTESVTGIVQLTSTPSATEHTMAATPQGVQAAINNLDVNMIGVGAATGDRFICQVSQQDGLVNAAMSTATIGSASTPVYIQNGEIMPCNSMPVMTDYVLRAGDTMTGTLTVDGFKGTMDIDYGDSLPLDGEEGRIFFQISDPFYELPTGGTTGQALVKTSGIDRAVQWASVGVMQPNANVKYYVTGSMLVTENSNPAVFNPSIYIENDVLFGAAWNDYAEYRETIDEIQPGRCVIENGFDQLSLSNARMQPGAEIVSDTFGFAIGQSKKCGTPVAVTGRVLAYPYEDIVDFQPGRPVCSGPNGTVSLMTDKEARDYPWLIIGTVSAIPQEKTWGNNNVSTEGRIWIRVR